MEKYLAAAGAIQLFFALFLAWNMILFSHFKVKALVARVKSFRDLVRAHLDYLLMSHFLLLFFVLYKSLNIHCGALTVFLVCYGSTVNPLGFLMPALYPSLDNLPLSSPYKVFLYSGFLTTTLGFVLVGKDVLLAALIGK